MTAQRGIYFSIPQLSLKRHFASYALLWARVKARAFLEGLEAVRTSKIHTLDKPQASPASTIRSMHSPTVNSTTADRAMTIRINARPKKKIP